MLYQSQHLKCCQSTASLKLSGHQQFSVVNVDYCIVRIMVRLIILVNILSATIGMSILYQLFCLIEDCGEGLVTNPGETYNVFLRIVLQVVSAEHGHCS